MTTEDKKSELLVETKKEAKKAPEFKHVIWEEIKNKPFEIFGLPNQRVSDHCEVVAIGDGKDNLHLKVKASAVIGYLTELLCPNPNTAQYEVTQTNNGFAVISRRNDNV